MEPRRRFRFVKQISEGTFGKVYMCEMLTDSNFSKVVAIKLLHGKWLEHEEIVQRARDEARVLGLLNHRNIIRVEDLSSINGKCAVIMEYLDGVDLKSLIQFCKEDGLPIPLKVILDIVEAVSSAMYAAYHAQPPQGGEPLRLIHRDIKPSNIMLTIEGGVKILDFGTAQANFEDREAATVALTFGSAGYMAPERLLMDEKDRPSGDIYSLGVTMYELLTCKRFGAIKPGKEKFEQEIAQRLEVCTSDLERYENLKPEDRKTILSVLGYMLSYHHEDRPDLQQTLNLMEELSSRITGITLRKFCRETVASCKEKNKAEPKKEDPLEGTTVWEDASQTFSRMDTSPDGMLEPVDIGLGTNSISTGNMVTIPPNQIKAGWTDSTASDVKPTASTNHSEPMVSPSDSVSMPRPQPKSSSKLLFIVGGVLLLGVIVGAIFAVPLILQILSPEKTTDTNTVVQTETKVETKTKVVNDPPKPEILPGDTHDLGASKSPITVNISIAKGDLDWIRVKTTGFNHKIVGKGKIVLNNAPSSKKYTLSTSDEKIGMKILKIKKDCTIKLDVKKSKWNIKDCE